MVRYVQNSRAHFLISFPTFLFSMKMSLFASYGLLTLAILQVHAYIAGESCHQSYRCPSTNVMTFKNFICVKEPPMETLYSMANVTIDGGIISSNATYALRGTPLKNFESLSIEVCEIKDTGIETGDHIIAKAKNIGGTYYSAPCYVAKMPKSNTLLEQAKLILQTNEAVKKCKKSRY